MNQVKKVKRARLKHWMRSSTHCPNVIIDGTVFVTLLRGDGCSSKISIKEFGDLEGVMSENSYQSYAFL